MSDTTKVRELPPQTRTAAENLLCAAGFERWDAEARLFTYPVWDRGLVLAAVCPPWNGRDQQFFHLKLIEKRDCLPQLDENWNAIEVPSLHFELTKAIVKLLGRCERC